MVEVSEKITTSCCKNNRDATSQRAYTIHMKQILPMIMVISASVGLFDATYLTYEKLTLGTLKCGGSYDCGTVVNSAYGSVGNVPVSAFGMTYYFLALLIASALLTEIPLNKIIQKYISATFLDRMSIEDYALTLSAIGMMVTVVLIYIMAFVLKAWCLYCLLSAFSTFVYFIASCASVMRNEQSYLREKIGRCLQ